MPTRVALGLALLLAAAPLALPALAQDAGRTRLVLSETASREVEQDTLVAVLSARAESPSAREAQSAVNGSMAAAIQRARAIESVRLATGGYRGYQQHDREGRPTTWIAEQDLRITSRESAPLLELVGQLQDAGLNASGLAYELSDGARRALESDLAIEAIDTLRSRAERIAASMGMRIDAIQTVRVGGPMGEPPPRPMMRMSMAEAADMAPPTALPDLEAVSVSVEAEITLAPRQQESGRRGSVHQEFVGLRFASPDLRRAASLDGARRAAMVGGRSHRSRGARNARTRRPDRLRAVQERHLLDR